VATWPKQGSKAPWRVYQNYIRDILSLKWSPVANAALSFSNPVKNTPKPALETARQRTA
jgi:monooxygenase